MKVLVLGAGGFLGSHVVRAWLAAGHEVRAGRRRRSNVLALARLPVEKVEADLDGDLVPAMRGVDVVVHAAGHYPRDGRNPDSVALGARQMRAVLDAAAAAGVPKLVYLSSTATASTRDEAGIWPEPPGFGVYHDLKWAMEALARAEDRLDLRVLCPSACLGPGDWRVGTSALLVALARGVDPPHPDGWIGVVDARDVATATLRVAEHPDPPRRMLLSAHNLRLHAFFVELAARYGVAPPSPPLGDAEAVALADRLEAEAAEKKGRALLAREIADLVVHGLPHDARLAQRTLDLHWTPLAQTLDDFDAWARTVKLIPGA